MLKIDVHTHILPERLPDFRNTSGGERFVRIVHESPRSGRARMMVNGSLFREIESNSWSVEARLAECDADGVGVQVLSTVPVLFSYWAEPDPAIELARHLNDHIAGVVAAYPRRFIGLGTVPMQSPDLAIRELERCMSDLGLVGVEIGSNVNGANLDSPELFPIFEAAASLGAAVFVHPWEVAGRDRMERYWLPWLVGMPAETSLAICSLIFGGVLERLPALRIAFAHGGGAFPATIGRIAHGFDVRPDLCAVTNGVSPREYLRRIYLDSLVHDPLMLRYLVDLMGADRIALGSDYPFPLGEARPGALIDSCGFPEETRARLLHGTALEWLGLPAGALPVNAPFQTGRDFALVQDREDPLGRFREEFRIPKTERGEDEIYFAGNSLGLMPKRAPRYVVEELEKWKRLAVKAHFSGENPWMPYHEFLAEPMANLVGASSSPSEVVTMNSLTVNLHLMMASFYRPTRERHRILLEDHAFPSDDYALESQAILHGFDPAEALQRLRPVEGKHSIDTAEIADVLERDGGSIALVLLPGVQYYTGQAFDIEAITRLAHAKGCVVGFDLAHAAGNLVLRLHDWNVDFAVWCTYKYLNSGPGSVGGCFVHQRHGMKKDLPRLAGWWGHDKESRFRMEPGFRPIPGAEGWQVSNPPILSLAAIRASLDVFREAGGMDPLREKSLRLTGYLEWLLQREAADSVEILTPADPRQRGCQLSFRVKSSGSSKGSGRSVLENLEASGVTCDWREPDVIRVAPVPLYNRYEEVHRFVGMLRSAL